MPRFDPALHRASTGTAQDAAREVGPVGSGLRAKAFKSIPLRFGRCGDGTTAIAGKLPDMHADMLRTRLEALSSPRRASVADRAHTGRVGVAAGGAVGGGGCSQVDIDGDHADTEIGRLTSQQRLGRAMCGLIEYLPAEAAGHGDITATLVVTMDLHQLQSGTGQAVLDTGTAISPGQARRLACSAGLVPMVLDGPSRILDVGAGRRLFDKHQRLALTVRDQGCVWPGCDRPPARCESHHVREWSRGAKPT
ncbi:MAG: HNH endonuclease signature motif containing protein [Nocardioidaceae bacterium]